MGSQHGTANPIQLNWKNDIVNESSLAFVDWNALQEFAIGVKRHCSNHDSIISCKLSAEYNMGGLHVVRRLDFQDGTSWVARLQQQKATTNSIQRLLQEVYTIEVIRQRTKIPVPEIIGYDAEYDNKVGVAFMILEFIPADTAMDSFGGWLAHKGQIPSNLKPDFHVAMADIQVDMASVRFPKIGSIVKLSDGTYSVGAIPGIGGPFDTAAEFFCSWAKTCKFPFDESTIRERTTLEVGDEIIKSINDFPLQLQEFAKHFPFQSGPFPIFHTDLKISNILVDYGCRIQSVIDWEDAIVAPWEVVEFIKDLTIVPPVMSGRFYKKELTREKLAE
ncbi:hypothetical protein EJ02DRAFT_363555, partial [Clathrospora elynae]